MNTRLKIIDLIGRTEINKWYNFLQKSQYWTIEEQQTYQNKKLQQLVEHAYVHVPYYRRLFKKLHLSPADIRKKEDLQKLPVIRRSDLQQNYKEFIADNHKSFHSQYRSTGGTTGEPVRYLSDVNTWSLHWALKYRSWEMSTYKIGDKVGIIGGASVIPEKSSVRRLVWNRLNNFLIMPSSHMSEEMLYGFVALIQKNRVKHLRGYPSSIASLARYCIDNSIVLNIESVITTAEVLQIVYKEDIKEAFNSIIIDSYGCADGGGNASTCSQDNGFHVSFESAIWEVCDVNGQPVAENNSGEVTLTSITNYAMPLLRYQPGDIIENTFIKEKCTCGRTLPRIKKIIGKTTDILSFSNGHSLGGPAFPQLFRAFPLIKWQMIQNDLFSLDINIITNEFFKDSDAQRIIELMQHHCGQGVKINLNRVSNIPVPHSGKQRIIINNTLK